MMMYAGVQGTYDQETADNFSGTLNAFLKNKSPKSYDFTSAVNEATFFFTQMYKIKDLDHVTIIQNSFQNSLIPNTPVSEHKQAINNNVIMIL